MAFGDVPNDPRPARLLIVEDDVLLASALQELLSDSGFEVVGTPALPLRPYHSLKTKTRD
jgi:BarA-like signal transduction histidine kinase